MATLTKEMKIFSYQTSPVVGWKASTVDFLWNFLEMEI